MQVCVGACVCASACECMCVRECECVSCKWTDGLYNTHLCSIYVYSDSKNPSTQSSATSSHQARHQFENGKDREEGRADKEEEEEVVV